MKDTILVADDEKDLLRALQIYLDNAGYEVLTAENGRQALDLLTAHQVDLVLMDIMMPEMDGIEATRRLRETSNVPIILLTAKGEDCDKIEGLGIGADDYITKPFNPTEVVARVKSQLRRYKQLGGAEGIKASVTVGPIDLNDDEKTVTLDGKPVSLTHIEYEILKLLMSHPGKVYSTDQIYRQVWKETPLGSDNVVTVHMCHIREKIELDLSEPRYLKAVWGHGYKIEDPAGKESSGGKS